MASLRYRSPVDGRDPLSYARWVRELRGRNGAYVIRDADTREVLYVGESHTGRLYATLTRHFQFWDGYTAGTTYDRDAVDVAICRLGAPSKDVVHGQIDLIIELSPRDNTHHQAEFEDADDFVPADFEDDWA